MCAHDCGEWCTLGCHADLDDMIEYKDDQDFELGTACDLGDTDCESCQ